MFVLGPLARADAQQVAGLVHDQAVPLRFATRLRAAIGRADRRLPRAFRTPLAPILSMLASAWLMVNLPAQTWVRFGIWMTVGLGVYFGYGRAHSRLATAGANSGLGRQKWTRIPGTMRDTHGRTLSR